MSKEAKGPQAESVKVYVRVRPFLQKKLVSEAKFENGRDNIVTMEDPSTYLKNPNSPEAKPLQYTFDASLWSHTPGEPGFISQAGAFEVVGKPLLENFTNDYNVCLFAYGQSGSGKSFTMVGDWVDEKNPSSLEPPEQAGLVPRLVHGMFEYIKKATVPGKLEFTTRVSMSFIYNEKVYDLLNNKKLLDVVRLAKETIVKDRTEPVVDSYEKIKHWFEYGQKFQVVSATGLNDGSSRGHTVFDITLVARTPGEKKGEWNEKPRFMRLIDLAGSERVGKSGAGGDTLAEGNYINLSLSNLGDIIKKLVTDSRMKDAAARTEKIRMYPEWRRSKLSMLLQDCLGGANCKTGMMVALNPSPFNFDETNTTLKYANKAKQIQNMAAKVAASPAQQIQELKKQLEEMQKKLAAGGGGGGGATTVEKVVDTEEVERLQHKIRQEQDERKKFEDDYRKLLEEKKAAEQAAQTFPQLTLLSPDDQLNRLVKYIIKNGENKAGSSPGNAITVKGLRALDSHAIFINSSNVVKLTPIGGAFCLVNGKPVKSGESKQLTHNDRVILGQENCFVFLDPKVLASQSADKNREDAEKYNFQFLQKELLDSSSDSPSLVFVSPAEEEKRKKEIEEKLAAVAKETEQIKRQKEEGEKQLVAKLEKLEAESKAEREKLKGQTVEQQQKLQREQQQREAALKQQWEAELKKKQEELDKVNSKLERERKHEMELENERKRNLAEVEREARELQPLVQRVNQMCSEMKIPLVYSLGFERVRTQLSDDFQLTHAVVNVLTPQKVLKAQLHAAEFKLTCERISMIYDDFQETKKVTIPEPSPSDPHANPFRFPVIKHKIGEAIVPMLFLYSGLPTEDDVTPILELVSNNETKHSGELMIKLTPVLERMSYEGDTLREFEPKLTELNVRLQISWAKHIPDEYNWDVFVSFSFPNYVAHRLIALHKDPTLDGKGDEDFFEFDEDLAYETVRVTGKSGEKKLSFEFDRVFRFQLTQKTLDWLENGLLYFEVWGHPADQKDQKPMYAEAESKGKTGNKEAKFSHRVKPSVVNLQRSEVESLARESAEGGVDEKRHGKKKAEMASVVRGVLHKAKARVASETETQGKIKSLNRTASSIGQSPRTARSTISESGEDVLALQKQLEESKAREETMKKQFEAERKQLDAEKARLAQEAADLKAKSQSQREADLAKSLKEKDDEVAALKQQLAKATAAQQQNGTGGNNPKSSACSIL